MTIVLALFLIQTPASQQASVAVSASQAPSTSASISRSVIVQQLPVGLYTTVQRRRSDGTIDPAWLPGGALDESTRAAKLAANGGQRIAVVLDDHLPIEDARDLTTNRR